MLKKIASNIPRAGLLAIPVAGAALEKIIYGPLDDKSKENERNELISALNNLSKNLEFEEAGIKSQLTMLAKKIEDVDENLSNTIRDLNPVSIEVEIVQHIQPIMINIFTGMKDEEITSLFTKTGIPQTKIVEGETSDALGNQLINSASLAGKIPELIQQLEPLFPGFLESQTDDDKEISKKITSELIAASRPLLTWPTTIGENNWLERNEVNLIEDKISSNEIGTTLILGKPGSGKSALLSYLSNRLINNGFPVLGIKADMLPKSVSNLSELQKYLQLTYSVNESLSQSHEDKVPVLIIDQLDALSELVDRNSDRLNVLLSLIQSVASTNKAYIISSCRWFEYQHDVRLTTIEAEKIDLAPPLWAEIETILKDAGFPTENFSEETKALCSIPLHLKILLELKNNNDDLKIPSSLQALLENIWQERIVTGENVAGKLEIIENLSVKMAEEEELWIARVFADQNISAFQELLRVNILKLDDAGLRIGFVHQTYFDFARARSFAAGRNELSNYVFARQDGLFIRPILLRTLSYLRDTSPRTYSTELTKLWNNKNLRAHIRTLLLEYIGAIEYPNEIELAILLPLFEDDKYRYKALGIIAGSPGWFNTIRETHLSDLMRNDSMSVQFLIPILSRGFVFDRKAVIRLIQDSWLQDEAFDEHILNLMTNLSEWDEESVDIVCKVAKRHESHWIQYVAEIVSQKNPKLAPQIVLADFDRQLDIAIKEEAEYTLPPQPKPDADEVEKAIYEMSHTKRDIIEKLLKQDRGWHDLSIIAETSPEDFINCIWPWYLKVIGKIAYEPHPYVSGYQEDHSIGTCPEKEIGSDQEPITALSKGISEFSRTEPQKFVQFFLNNIESPYLAVHRLLCIGLLQLIESHPDLIFDYLIDNPKRLVVGDYRDQHKYSKRLISKLIPKLSAQQRQLLEGTVLNWNRYYQEDPEWTLEDKFKRTRWNKQHRLRLMRAFPKEFCSKEFNIIKEQIERAFPKTQDWDLKLGGAGFVGSPMSHEQMVKAENGHIVNLFSTLTDDTEWDHPNRRWDHVGGSIQASREFSKFAEKDPERAIKILFKFLPGKQERPAGMGIEGLSKSDCPTETLLKVINTLVDKGFSTGEFRREVARGLKERANKEKRLPDDTISMLKTWYQNEPHPDIKDREENEEKKENHDESILWGYGGVYSLPGGRDIYIEAIALGYLLRQPPEYIQFSKFIEIMLQSESHPKIWHTAFHWMKCLFNWDETKTTEYYDHVIKKVPEVVEYKNGIIEYANILNVVPDKKIIQQWICEVGGKNEAYSKQAFGELLFFYNLIYRDDQWAMDQIYQTINDPNCIKEHCGIAFAAAKNWHQIKHQAICTEIIIALSKTKDKITQNAISSLFHYGQKVVLNKDMKKIILAIISNDGILIKSAESLVEGIMDYTTIEPEIVGDISSRVIDVGKSEIMNPGSRYSMVAEPIVSIALTLHRMQEPHRSTGLNLFEQLIESNIPDARQALDLLDRKPVTRSISMRLRRRIKRRQR